MKTVFWLFAGFWALILVAGSLNPGYRHYREHVSLLAAQGSRYAWITMLAIVLTAVAQWVAARHFWEVNRVVAYLLVVAGLALLAVAVFRVPCPEKARYCTFVEDHTTSETLHAAGVITYAIVTMTAMVILGITALTRGHHSLVGVPGLIASAVFALTFSGLLLFPAGLAQRTWIAVGQIWLVAAVFEAQLHRERLAGAVRDGV